MAVSISCCGPGLGWVFILSTKILRNPFSFDQVHISGEKSIGPHLTQMESNHIYTGSCEFFSRETHIDVYNCYMEVSKFSFVFFLFIFTVVECFKIYVVYVSSVYPVELLVHNACAMK